MSLREWNGIIEKVESDKAKDRSEGISRYRDFLSNSRNFKALCDEENHKWLKSLQALFQLVIVERNAFVTKKAATTQKRLEEAAQLVQWTVTKVHTRISRKTIKAVFAHLTQLVAVQGKLQHFALIYLKTLRLLLSYPPHLEHLDERQWTDVVSLCFAAVLGDKVKVGQEFEDDAVMEIDHAKDTDSEDEGARGALRPTPKDTSPGFGAGTKRVATLEDIELLACIEVAFRSASAPFIAYSAVIFQKFLRFFRLFPVETTAHAPALQALVRAFAELDLNSQVTMSDIGPQFWTPILDLWATKNPILKEQVIMALKHLHPFVAGRDVSDQNVVLKLKPLFVAIESESTIRWRDAYELNIDALRLGLEASEDARGSSAYTATTFRIGVDFTDKHAVAWTVLELGADCLARLQAISEHSPPAVVEQSEGAGRQKRRKVEQPLTAFLDAIETQETVAQISFRAQLVLFLIERHWQSLQVEAHHSILRAMLQLSNHDDPQVQKWALMALAAIAHSGLEPDPNVAQASPSKRTRLPSNAPSEWDQIWSLSTRRIANPTVCRVACHVANVLLAMERVSTSTVASSFESLARDLDVQGPNFPSDAVCDFFEWGLAITASDIRLFRLRFAEKVVAWICSAWKPLEGLVRIHSIGQSRPRADPFFPSSLLSLIARVCGFETVPNLPNVFLVPDCAIAKMAVGMAETAPVRDFVNARVPAHSSAKGKGVEKIAFQTPDTLGATVSNSGANARRISVWLERLLKDLDAAGEEGGAVYWTGLGIDVARRHLDLAALALSSEALIAMHGSRASLTTIKAACVVLSHLTEVLALKKWQPTELLSLLDGLTPLIVPLSAYPSVSYPVLLDPGPASGINRQRLPPTKENTLINFDSFEFRLLRSIWGQPLTREVVSKLAEVLHEMMGGLATAPPDPTQPATQRRRDADDDDFGEIKVAKQQVYASINRFEYAESECMSFCVRGLISDAMADGVAGSVRVSGVVDMILEAEGAQGIVIAEQTFNAVRAGLLDFRRNEALNLLNHFGSVLLPDYRFARDERVILAILRFMECTGTMWIPDDDGEDEGLGTRVRELCQWFTTSLAQSKLYCWRVRLRFLAFLDTYLAIDPRQLHWNTVGSAYPLPTGIIPSLLGDKDFRVRFRAASSAPSIFTLLHVVQGTVEHENELFRDIKSNLDSDLAHVERQLTQYLCDANLVIASASRRRAGYLHLVVHAGVAPSFSSHIVALLTGVTLRLGLADYRDLFLNYRTYYAHQLVRDQVQATSFMALGYSSLADLRRADYLEHGSITLAHRQEDRFELMCDVLKRPRVACAVACLPYTLAHVILAFTLEQLNRDLPWSTLRARLDECLAYAGGSDAFLASKLFESVLDVVAAQLFSMIFETSWTPGILPALGDDESAAQTFRELLDLSAPVTLVELPPPIYHARVVVTAYSWLAGEYSAVKGQAVVYSTIRHLLSLVHAQPFLDAQRALLINVAVAIALSSHAVKTSTVILESIASSVVDLLRVTPELAEIGVGIVTWALKAWLQLIPKSSTTAEDLCAQAVRAALVCKVYLDDADPRIGSSFRSLGVSLEQSVLRPLGHLNVDESVISTACLLWPWSLGDLVALDVQHALASPFRPTSKFGLVRAFAVGRTFLGEAATTQSEILWRLMEAMTPRPALEDCSSFVDLLYDASGNTAPPSVAVLAKISPDTSKEIQHDADIQQTITARLLSLLRSPDQSFVHLAFHTLRQIFANAAESADLRRGLAGQASKLAEYLSIPLLYRAREVTTSRARDVAELTSDVWVARGRWCESWILQFTQLLADSLAFNASFYAQLEEMLQRNTIFARDTLPSLVHAVLLRDVEKGSDAARATLSRYFRRLLEEKQTSTVCLECIVSIVLHLRQYDIPSTSSGGESSDAWLDIPWSVLAAGAARNDSHTTILLLLELAHEYDGLFCLDEHGLPLDRLQDDEARALLDTVYAAIDEPDGFYGHPSTNVRQSLVHRFRHEGRWNDAFGLYGAEYETSSTAEGATLAPSASSGIVESLAARGFSRLAMSMLQPSQESSSGGHSTASSTLSYDLAWRTDAWDLPIEPKAIGTSSVALYSALKSVYTSRGPFGAQQGLDGFIVSETTKLASVSVESPNPNNEAISTLLALREVRQWASLDVSADLGGQLGSIFPSLSPSFKYEHAERMLSTRISLMRTYRMRERANMMGDATSPVYEQIAQAEQTCLLELSRLARGAGHLQASLNAVSLAHKLVREEAGTETATIDEEFANVLWSSGEHTTAIAVLQAVAQPDPIQQAVVLSRLGKWTSEARMKSAMEIKDTYFDPAYQLASAATDVTLAAKRAEIFGTYARFADSQYQDINQAADLKRQRFRLYQHRKKREISELEKQLRSTSESSLRSQLLRSKNDAMAYIDQDERELKVSEDSAALLLFIALENYSSAMASADSQDDQIFRFCALWLEQSGNVQLHEKLRKDKVIARIPSQKYVFLVHQLSARLSGSSKPSPFAKNLGQLVLRISQEHPFHSLYAVYALRDGVVPTPVSSRSRRSSTSASADAGSDSSSSQSSSARAQAAEEIFSKLKKLPNLRPRIEALELVCQAYIEWSLFDVKSDPAYIKNQKTTKSHSIRKDMLISSRVQNLAIPVSTFDLPVDCSGTYSTDSFPHIVKYDEHYSTAGGLHLPKIVNCIGSDGNRYCQLLKGGDDIRQDAVMEQTFMLINKLLLRDERTRQRRLHLRTYRAIPLQGQTGVIEFVANTRSLGEVLEPLYRAAPRSLQPRQARERISKWEQKKKSDPNSDWQRGKDLAFREVLEKMPPVLRHFFFQQHQAPSLWFDMRLNYSRSVATTSMIGHIVGLGDRHVSNILMDCARGDLVAIDLGIAFDQGKRLPLPETVPFRLTQNIVDGFGMSGVEGVFRRCSEEVLRVLRERSQVVMTVLEVFKHDPLQHWAISVDIARQLQGSEEGEGAALHELPDDADRALAIVAGKLDQSLSVEYTVNQLIQEATDITNLGRLFVGWQPYL